MSEAGLETSVGSKSDSYANALAETINDLYNAEMSHRRAPWTTRETVELVTPQMSWFNNHRLMELSGAIPARPKLKKTTTGNWAVRLT